MRLPPVTGEKEEDGLIKDTRTKEVLKYSQCPVPQWQFIDGCQRDWDALPPPGPPITVGLDGGFVHAKNQKSRGEGWFEVIAGKSMPEEGVPKCFAYVQKYDSLRRPLSPRFETLSLSCRRGALRQNSVADRN